MEDQVGPNHEAMRLLVLSRFEDDVLLRQDVEAWLDEVVAPGEEIQCECAELGLCHCPPARGVRGAAKWRKQWELVSVNLPRSRWKSRWYRVLGSWRSSGKVERGALA